MKIMTITLIPLLICTGAFASQTHLTTDVLSSNLNRATQIESKDICNSATRYAGEDISNNQVDIINKINSSLLG